MRSPVAVAGTGPGALHQGSRSRTRSSRSWSLFEVALVETGVRLPGVSERNGKHVLEAVGVVHRHGQRVARSQFLSKVPFPGRGVGGGWHVGEAQATRDSGDGDGPVVAPKVD